MKVQNTFHLMRHKRSRLALKDNRILFQALQLMPQILRNINPIAPTLPTQHHIPYNSPIIIMSSHPNLASQDNKTLILCWVPMYGYHSPWLHRIQHPMALVLQRLVEVIVHPQPLRTLRLCRYFIQQSRADYLHPLLVFSLALIALIATRTDTCKTPQSLLLLISPS